MLCTLDFSRIWDDLAVLTNHAAYIRGMQRDREREREEEKKEKKAKTGMMVAQVNVC